MNRQVLPNLAIPVKVFGPQADKQDRWSGESGFGPVLKSMEIEFSSNQLPPMNSGGSVVRANASMQARSDNSSITTDKLKSKLQEVPVTRADKVAQAKVLVKNTHYPPDDLLDRIAQLLAIRMTP
jgi:hypothetical protein